MKQIALMRGRVLRAVGADALAQVLTICTRLLLVPLFLSAWGAEAYGEWFILTAVAGWFALGDLGGQLYFVNRLTIEWALKDREEFQRVLSTGLAISFATSALLFLCVGLALTWSSTLGRLGLKAVNQDVALVVLLIMALRFLIALPAGLYLGIYRAIGAQATSVMFANLMLVIQFVTSAIALLAGSGMLVLAALEMLPLLLVAPFVGRDLRTRLPADIKLLALGEADSSILCAAISPSLHFLGIQLAMAIMIQGTVIVVGKTLGPVEVAIFSTMRTVSNVVLRFLAILSHSAWPEFTRLESTGQTEKLTQLFKSILFISLLGGVIYLVVLQVFGERLFHWWLNHKLPYDPIAMFLMGCLVILTAMWTLGGNLLMATNYHEGYARLQLPVNLLALWSCYWGATTYGLAGAVMGIILGQSILMIGIVIRLQKRKGWINMAACLFRISAGAMILIPMCLNIWSGLVGIVFVAGLTARQFGWREFPTRKVGTL